MKKIYSLIATALLGVATTAQAQMFAWEVQATKADYTDITGGTVLDLQGTVGEDFANLLIDSDGELYFNAAEDAKAFPIGFDFNYNSKTMKYFLIGTDGEILLSDVETVTTDIHKHGGANLFTNNNYENFFGFSMRNGFYGYEDTEISYKLEGDAGNRVLIIQYKNVAVPTASWNADQKDVAKAQLQYRLYEKSGNISIQVSGFKPFDGADVGSSNFTRLGLVGDKGDRQLVNSFDGSETTTGTNSIKYFTGEGQYPEDGTTYTFLAPEDCMTPEGTLSNLQLTSTSTQISGSFKPSDADHYLVLAKSSDDCAVVQPYDKTKYAVGDEVGGAKVIAVVSIYDEQFNYNDSPTFSSPNNMKPNTGYMVYLYPFNSIGANGPLYGKVTTATIKTKPAAPAELKVAAVEKNSITLSVVAAGETPVLIAMSDRMALNHIGQALGNGYFGEPIGSYNVGDVIDYEYTEYVNYEPAGTFKGQNTVVYVGGSSDAIEITGLEAGKEYFFRAWSSDGEGAYSSVYLDLCTITTSELPWVFVPDMAGSFDPVGWTFDGQYTWTNNERAEPPYFANQISFTSTDDLKEAWMESPAIELGKGTNKLKIDIMPTLYTFRTFASPSYEMQEGEEIAVQLTTDGEQYVNILTLNKDNMPAQEADEEMELEAGNYYKNGEYTSFDVDFSEFAGETVHLRLYVKRYTNGGAQFANLSLSNNGGGEATEATVTYALQVGETHPSGDVVEVKNADEVVASLIFGEAGEQVEGSNAYADFKAAKADGHIEGFEAFTEGNGENGNKAGGTFYTIVPAYDGTVTIGVVLNSGKAFYILEDGTALPDFDGIKVEEKYYGTYTFDVKANSSYKFYCAGSKLGFYGFNYTYTADGTTVGINEISTLSQPAVEGIFTLSGQRLDKPQKGLNIINGRKVMVK